MTTQKCLACSEDLWCNICGEPAKDTPTGLRVAELLSIVTDLGTEVGILKTQINLMSPPASLFLAENGHRHLCIWQKTEDERFPRQVFNLAADTSYGFYDLIVPWLERVLPYRDGSDPEGGEGK